MDYCFNLFVVLSFQIEECLVCSERTARALFKPCGHMVACESMFVFHTLSLLERFSFECRKAKTKVITLTNHNSRKQFKEPIRARSKYMSPVPSAGKRVRVSHDWFFF